MDINLIELLEDENWALNFVRKQFGVPDDVFRECGASYLHMAIYGSNDDIALSRGTSISNVPALSQQLLTVATAEFERLCQSAPNIPRPNMKALSMAFGTYLIATDESMANSLQDRIKMLIDVAMVRGTAMSALPFQVEEMKMARQIEKNEMLSIAGTKGQKIKNALPDELKKWALEESMKLTGLPASKARMLMKILPDDLNKKLAAAGNRLLDPERVIREALVKQRKSTGTPSQSNVTDSG